MSQKVIILLFGSFLFSPFFFVHAGVVFNEVQLNLTQERFIELYNTDNTEVDLTGWYLQRKTQNGSSFSSLVANSNFANKKISAHGYFVISRSVLPSSDIVVDTLTLTESNTIQIKNNNGTVVDKIGWGSAIDCINPCPTNPTDSSSLQLISGSWSVATPTPGVQNEPPVSNPPTGTGGSSSSSSGSTSTIPTTLTPTSIPTPTVIATKTVEAPAIKTKIVAKNSAFMGLPIELRVNTTGFASETLSYGKYFWNFGDGDSKEINLSSGEKIMHTYFYPGEYIVSLEYYKDYYNEIPDATNKLAIKVVPLAISISKVGDEKDFFVELSNTANYEMDVSRWSFNSSLRTFFLPKNTIILGKNKMTLSPKVTNFNFEDSKTLKLMNATGDIVFDYGALILVANNIDKTPVDNSQDVAQVVKEKIIPVELSKKDISIVSDRNILMSNTKIPMSDRNNTASVVNSSFLSIPTIGFLALLMFSGGTVYFLRRKNIPNNIEADFDILDE